MNFSDLSLSLSLSFKSKSVTVPIIIHCSLLPVELNMANNLDKEHETHVLIPALSLTSIATLKNMLILIGG